MFLKHLWDFYLLLLLFNVRVKGGIYLFWTCSFVIRHFRHILNLRRLLNGSWDKHQLIRHWLLHIFLARNLSNKVFSFTNLGTGVFNLFGIIWVLSHCWGVLAWLLTCLLLCIQGALWWNRLGIQVARIYSFWLICLPDILLLWILNRLTHLLTRQFNFDPWLLSILRKFLFIRHCWGMWILNVRWVLSILPCYRALFWLEVCTFIQLCLVLRNKLLGTKVLLRARH